MRTGAERILNSKSVFNRSSNPRIVCQESKQDEFLGDRESMPKETEAEEDDDSDCQVILTVREKSKEEREND